MITIINYGSGNINAIVNTYKRLNIPYNIAENIQNLEKASKLILPGVGAFDNNMKQLNESGLRSALDDLVINKKIPILGICLGLQIMAKDSDEGIENGLGWIKGSVKKFNIENIESKPKIPHMGWNSIKIHSAPELFKGINPIVGFYFVHSYYLEVENADDIMTTTYYGGEFVSAIHYNNIYATQFHPEKSHSNGIKLLKNYADLKC